MKKSKMLKPINVMTTSFLLASSLLMPSAGFAEELSTPKNKDSSNAQTSEVKTQEARTQTTETQSPGKAVSKMMANETVVNNFQELKVALEADNGITTIHLGRDIDISGAIKIHPAKSKIVIDGNYHTVTETGATGASGGIYANGNILSSVHVKNLYIYGKNYYGFITIHDVTKNVEQIYENVNYNGPQFIWNRNGNAIFKGVNDIYIQDNAVPGSSITHEMAETGRVEFDGETHISHNSGHALIWSISKEPQFKIAPNANVKIFTNKSGYGIFYATGGDGDFSIGANAKVEIDGKKGVTSSGKFKSFNVDAGADVQMNRSGTDSYPMISLYGPAQINNQANLHVTTEDGHALEVENKPSTIDFNNPNNVVLSSIKKQAINNLSTSLTMSMDTSMAKFWTSATGDPTNSYVGKSGGNLTWKAMYRYNVAQSISSSNPENFIIEFTKTKKIELGKNDGGQAEKDLADAKNKVEDLFTDDKFDTLKGNTDQGAIDKAKDAVNKLPAGPEKERLEDLLNKAQDLLNKKEQAEKDLNDAKNKVEDLFTDDKFDTLKGSTDQGAIDKAKDAVSKLPAGPEKERLEDLLNKAQDLLNKKEQAEKDLNDAKNKVEDLFTDDKFDTLKGSTDQGAIDKAKDAVNKLPAGPEKERLEDLLNKAQDLLNKKEQAEKDLNDAKNKVEDLFTDDKFDTLEGTTDQGAIDEAQEAVDKLPEGAEKDRLQDLLNKAQDLLNKKEQAEKDLADAKNKVEDLFTDDKFDTLEGSTDQGAIDKAKDAVSKLPAGPEKERLEDLLNKAQDLLNKKEQAEKDLADAKNKVEDLFTDDKFDTLEGTTDQGAIDEAQEAVDKLPEGAEKDRLQDLLNKAQDLLDKDITAPNAPKLNEVTTNSKEVTGSGEPEANVTVTINSNKYTGVVGPDGKFKVAIPNQPVNTVITVTLTDTAGNVSESSSARVIQFMPSEPVKIDTVYKDAQTITGTAPEGATIVRLLVNGVALRTAHVNEDGTFSIYSRYVGVDENGNNITLQPGDNVTVDYGMRTPSNLQAHTTVIKEAEKLQVNPVAPNADYVTGKAPEGTMSLRLLVNGIAQRTVSLTQTGSGVINTDGSYQIYSRFIVDEHGVTRRLQAGDVIEVDNGPLVVGGDIAKTIVK
ncbi:hypothetical protein FQP34_21340 [Peribacillus simplex]|uniref:Bacterial Ig domain-containing protein n=1 Tax=Peribacillus simplex TaxID=1478 RepID=A0A8B5XTF3_9BACI|nr:toxin Cry1Ac domain D-VI-related protein [Peribacillus simplex]TVX77694.1 hypothetical protein FQP34_21340 [Peribacillus simplex]